MKQGCGVPGCPYCWHDVDPVDDSDLELDDLVDDGLDIDATAMVVEAKTNADEHVDELVVRLEIAKAAQRNVHTICDAIVEASKDGEREILIADDWEPGGDEFDDAEYADDIEYLEIQMLEDAGFIVEPSDFAVTDVRYTKTIRW